MNDTDYSPVEFQVPCPADELVRIVFAICRDDSVSLSGVLRTNPALLLFVLASHQDETGASPADAKSLIHWCKIRLIELLANAFSADLQATSQTQNFKKKKLNAFFNEFVRSRNNKRLRSSLQKFLTKFCDQNADDSKAIVRKLVGKKLRADSFQFKGLRKKKTVQELTERWAFGNPNIDLAMSLRLAQSYLESSSKFSARLNVEKLAAMKQLAYGASHEINNPLANVATRAQTMLAVETDPEKRHKLAVIYEQAMRAHEMISDMMLFAHPPALQRKRVSVRILISRLINQMEAKYLSNPQIATSFTVSAGVDQVDVDPTQVSVAIRSLIQNSFEALTAPPNLTSQSLHRIDVRIGLSPSGDLEISVCDSGLPIEPEVVRHLFDPFYSGREAGRGLGFGLSKSWAIAKLHGGSLTYDANSELGTRFVLTIPSKDNFHDLYAASSLSICKNQVDVEDAA
jgi:signal transduction histidine kinase